MSRNDWDKVSFIPYNAWPAEYNLLVANSEWNSTIYIHKGRN